MLELTSSKNIICRFLSSAYSLIRSSLALIDAFQSMLCASSLVRYGRKPVNSNPLPLKTDLYSPVFSPKSPRLQVASSRFIIGRKSTFISFIENLWHWNPTKDFLYYLVLVDSLALPFIIYYYPMPQHICCDTFDIIWSDKRFSLH